MKISFFMFMFMFMFSQAVLAQDATESCEGGNLCVVNLDKNAATSTVQSVMPSLTQSPSVTENTIEAKSVVPSSNTQESTQANKAQILSDVFVNHVNPSAQVQFESNPTTGYSWAAKNYDSSLIALESKYIPSKTKLVGSGGQEQWTITATPKALNEPTQMTKIIFIYRRPWEKNIESAQTKTVTVQIN